MDFKKNYETVFILNPVLSEDQMKDAATKFSTYLRDNGAEILNEENWGLQKLAYPIGHKSTGFYYLIEFEADTQLIKNFEIEYRRDERVMRFLTVMLNKHALEYSERRRKGEFKKNKKETKEESAA